jgi:hypothetical protein
VSAPRSIPGTYDAFDLERDLHGAWAVINASSAPGCQAVIQGIPAFVDNSSLARPVANLDLRDIESPLMPDRETWLTAVSHTEWLLEEFITGDPQLRLMQSH